MQYDLRVGACRYHPWRRQSQPWHGGTRADPSTDHRPKLCDRVTSRVEHHQKHSNSRRQTNPVTRPTLEAAFLGAPEQPVATRRPHRCPPCFTLRTRPAAHTRRSPLNPSVQIEQPQHYPQRAPRRCPYTEDKDPTRRRPLRGVDPLEGGAHGISSSIVSPCVYAPTRSRTSSRPNGAELAGTGVSDRTCDHRSDQRECPGNGRPRRGWSKNPSPPLVAIITTFSLVTGQSACLIGCLPQRPYSNHQHPRVDPSLWHASSLARHL